MKRYLNIALLLIGINSFSQENERENFTLSGYISNMQSVMFEDAGGDWIIDDLFHNRLNASWYPGDNIAFTLQVRNRLMFGETLELFSGYAENIDNEQGFMDLSLNIFNKQSCFLNTSIDRIFFQVTRGKLVTTIGRQRINWGVSNVWNPNDLFNVQNYFDFDYVEKPGSDAVRIQYYTGASSSAEIAAKVDRNEKVTAAGLFRFTQGSYDMQFLAGMFEEQDIVAGMGWSGGIKNIGFKGEMSYFHPMKEFNDTTGLFMISAGGDYMFPNSLFIQFEAFYSKSSENSAMNFLSWYSEPLTVKKISFTDVSLFGGLSYPLNPLLNASLAGMYFPDLKGFFAGPGIDYSITDNMKLTLIGQYFNGEFPDIITRSEKRTDLFLGFIRYKFSF